MDLYALCGLIHPTQTLTQDPIVFPHPVQGFTPAAKHFRI